MIKWYCEKLTRELLRWLFILSLLPRWAEVNFAYHGRRIVTMNVPIPKNCIACMLRGGLTRNCGKMVKNDKAGSAGGNIYKVPDERCLLKGVDIPERLKKAMIEYGSKF